MKVNYKILLATDYSKAVMNAERYAVQFAKATNSIITLLHVYDQPLPPPVITRPYEEVLASQKKQELEKLTSHRDKILYSLDIKPDELITECVVKDGDAGKQIRKTAKESNADFIVVGTHGTSGFLEKILGTHSWNVIKNSEVPVLAIPKDALFTGIKNILFATEYREGELPVINYLARVAKQLNAGITVLHFAKYVLPKQFEEEIFGRFKKEVIKRVQYEKLSIRLVKNDDIVVGLEKYCEENNIDWLVMSPEKRLLFESIFSPGSRMTKKMSFRTRVPLFTIPDFYNPEHAGFWKLFESGDFVNEEF